MNVVERQQPAGLKVMFSCTTRYHGVLLLNAFLTGQWYKSDAACPSSFRSNMQQDEEVAAPPQLWVTWTFPGQLSVLQAELEQT